MPNQPDFDDHLCSAEFPGNELFVGQLCERERGHDGEHEHLAVIEGTRYSCRLSWPARRPA